MPSKLDPMQRARDFVFTPRPRVRPTSPARRIDAIARQSREASVSAAISGGGAASSVPIFDTLPDATPEDVSNIIYVAGASGQPAQGYIGVQTQDDRVIWEPVFTQAFYGAATEFTDEFYNANNWLQTASAGGIIVVTTASEAGHPGYVTLRTSAVAGNFWALTLGNMRMIDIDKAAFIFSTGPSMTTVEIRVGFVSFLITDDPPPDGVYLEVNSAETVWKFCKSISGTETRVNTLSSTATNNWWLFQVEYTGTPGEFLLSLTDLSGALGSDTETVTGLDEDVTVMPIFYFQNGAAASRDLKPDYFFIRHRATVRS